MSPAEVLRKAADLIEPEGAWTQGHGARDEDGAPITSSSEAAVCWCAFGAIWHAQGRMIIGETPAEAALGKVIGGARIDDWNDAPGRTQAEVVAALRKAADLAERSA